MKAQDGKPVSKTFVYIGNGQVRKKGTMRVPNRFEWWAREESIGYKSEKKQYDDYVAALPRYPFINNSGKEYKEGEEVEGEIGYERKHHGNSSIWIICSKEHYQTSLRENVRLVVRSVSQPAEKPDNFSPPDYGDICWTTGAETFTRKEVWYLLWTQRAMISNDLKSNCGDNLTKDMYEILKNPRKPIY